MMNQNQRYLIGMLLMLSVVFLPLKGYGQEPSLHPQFKWFTDAFDVSVKNTTAVRLHELDRFVKIENRLTLRYDNLLNDHLRFIFEGDTVYDAVYDVEKNFISPDSQEYRRFQHVELRPEDDRDDRTYIELQEALLELSFNRLNIRIGKQQQTEWGKVKEARITDVVKPQNLKEPGAKDLPLWMAMLKYDMMTETVREASLQLLMMPKMEFIKWAKVGSEYDALPLLLKSLPSSFLEWIPPGWSLIINPVKEPEVKIENTAFGFKLDTSNLVRKGWDVTFNYLYTWDDKPVFRLIPLSIDPITKTLFFSRIPKRLHVIGGTFDTVIDKFAIRGEIAAQLGKYFYLTPQGLSIPTIQKNLVSYGLECERKLWDISWIVQILQDRILDFDQDIIYPMSDAVSTKVTLRGSKKFRNDTFEFVLTTIYGIDTGEFFIRPTVKYDISDSTEIKIGADIFEGGKNDSLFGYLDDKDRVYVELKYSF